MLLLLLFSLKENPDGFNGVLLECDSTVQDSIMQLLKVYKIRRKVAFSLCPSLSIWALLPRNKATVLEKSKPYVTVADKVLVLEQDPRTELMGWRMITSSQSNPHEIISACQQGNTEEYHRHRYEIGIVLLLRISLTSLNRFVCSSLLVYIVLVIKIQ